MKNRIILGVDPSFTSSGYAILRSDIYNKVVLIEKGTLPLPVSLGLENRLSLFYSFFQHRIQLHGINELSLETPFLGKNAQNFLKLGYLRGILLLLASQHHLRVREFTPRQIKCAITGSGAADKDQVMRVVRMMFPRLTDITSFDVSDAIAISLCNLWSKTN